MATFPEEYPIENEPAPVARCVTLGDKAGRRSRAYRVGGQFWVSLGVLSCPRGTSRAVGVLTADSDDITALLTARKGGCYQRGRSDYPICSRPPKYPRSAAGILTVPSACWWISSKGMRTRGDASTVLLREWHTTLSPLPSAPPVR